MALRRKPRRRDTELAFEALSIEGGLLSPSWLARIAQLQADGQSDADYRVLKGLNLRDEIGRFWRVAQAHWGEFAGAPAKGTERFVLGLLRQAFGFDSLQASAPVEIGGRIYPVGYRALGPRVPVVIAPAGLGLDTASPAFGDGGRRRSAFGLAQELLNADDDALWALCTDGATLRILRDNGSLTRPAWIEADLGRIFTEERYADFAALWLLTHESRFGSADKPPTECALETWRTAGREEGTRAREFLRRGVEDAVVDLGQGFLAHTENTALRAALSDGKLSTVGYFQQLLRLVYRLIFLLTAEERGVLHAGSASEAATALYAQGYSVRRLRDRSVRRSAHDRFSDLWEGLKIVFRGLARGQERLGLPALGGLFAEDQCAALDGARLENRALLHALFRLSWLREESGLSRVNWRDMGPEELGSVYESLLELVPQIADGGRVFRFATGGETKGNARKTTGSYYTPDSLVQVLLDSALEPVVREAVKANPGREAEAVLELSVVDPACGSGHFLLSAARRLAGHVARLSASGTPSAAEYRHALRQVVGRCIFGVDLNPMAVELCKVSLWMEALEPGRPLSFLDSHVQCGNALLGATPKLIEKGIPDEAWEAIEGDDKKTASALKKQNKKERENPGQQELVFGAGPASAYGRLVAGVRAVDEAADETLADVEAKGRRWGEVMGSTAYDHERFAADLWCSAFVWRKEAGALREMAPTAAKFRAVRDEGARPLANVREEVDRLREQYRFFHWHLAFPQVHARGGFDVVLGNPPWERVKLQEIEFFASRDGAIAGAANAAARKKLIAVLPNSNPPLWRAWQDASREAEGQSHIARASGRYPLCGKGDVNTYALFAEHNRNLLTKHGRAGFVVPPGLVTDDTAKAFFQDLVTRNALVAVYEFENEEFLFPGIDHRVRFIVITVSVERPSGDADISFGNRNVQGLLNRARHFSLSPADFEVVNPNSRTCPTFRSRRDADLNIAIYRRAGVLQRDGDKSGDPWKIDVRTRLWHMAEDSAWFRTRKQMLAADCTPVRAHFVNAEEVHVPLLEAKMLHHYDHRFGTYAGQTESQENQGKLPEVDDASHADPHVVAMPCYWVPEHEVTERLKGVWNHEWLLGWRDICRSTDQRTVIAALLPRVAVGHTTPLLFVGREPQLVACFYANLCSFPLDYAARQKVGGTHLAYSLLKQLPILAPSAHEARAPWDAVAVRDWLLPRVLELTYTAWDLEPFAKDIGYEGPPFRWDPARRFLLRAELDAAFFRLYGIGRDDVDYILDTFPIVRKNDEKAHGEYRTKRVILEVYDAMAEAARTGRPYATRLDPPPADPRVAHPPRAAVQ